MKFLRVLHSLFEHLDRQPFGQRVGDARTHAVQTARRLVFGVIKLSARMQKRKDHLYACHAVLGVYVDGNASAVVLDACAVVRVKGDVYARTIAVGDLVYTVVDDLPKDVVHPFASGRADIHAGALADSVEPLKNFK